MSYTKDEIKIENVPITTQTLNKSLYKLFNNLLDAKTLAEPTSAQYATTSISGVIAFSDSVETSSVSPDILNAVSPYTLHNSNNLKILDSYYNNNLSNVITYNEASMQYILLPNKIVLMFGKINALFTSSVINFTKLFETTPYILSSLYCINIGGGENTHNLSPNIAITSISNSILNVVNITHPKYVNITSINDIQVSIAPNLTYTNGVANAIRPIDWIAIGKIG